MKTRKALIRNSPDLVMRPSGVWDSRAPLHSFLRVHQSENRTYFALLLALGRMMYDARSAKENNQVASARTLFKAKDAGDMASRAWLSFKKSFPSPKGNLYHPNTNDALNALIPAVPAATEYAIVSHCGLFETFCQCWALNSLLLHLESDRAWDRGQRELAQMFWTIRPRSYIPSFFDISSRLPQLETELTSVPHVFTDPRPKTETQNPPPVTLTAFAAVSFWRAWRNLLVHNSGFVSAKFEAEHHDFVADSTAMFPAGALVVGQRVSLTHETFRAVATVHHRAAVKLNDLLLLESGGKRGHAKAPGLPVEGQENVDLIEIAPCMLLPGDHIPSLRWVNDRDYRAAVRAQCGLT